MKKNEKLLAMVLTLALTVTALVMPASAADDEAVPCGEVALCPSCFGAVTTYENWRDNGVFPVASCSYSTSSHTHHSYRVSEVTECGSCDYSREKNVRYVEVCLG